MSYFRPLYLILSIIDFWHLLAGLHIHKLHYITSHTYHCITLHYTTLHYITKYITFLYLHCSSSHYIILHSITFIHVTYILNTEYCNMLRDLTHDFSPSGPSLEIVHVFQILQGLSSRPGGRIGSMMSSVRWWFDGSFAFCRTLISISRIHSAFSASFSD